MKKLMLILALAVASYGIDLNFNGFGDTTLISGTFAVDSIVFSDAHKLSAGENVRVIMFARDTNIAGFATDDLEFDWGYQTGQLTIDTIQLGPRRSSIDTAWDIRIKLSEFSATNFGTDSEGLLDSTNILVRSVLDVDTLHIAGWAYMSRNFSPEWDTYIRYWVQFNTGISTGDVQIRPQHNQRIGFVTKPQ